MRVLGFSKKWDKLQLELPVVERSNFTTFRFTRRDRDWGMNEVVQVVYKPRSKERETLGVAGIIRAEERDVTRTLIFKPIPMATNKEAQEDGFGSYWKMWQWLRIVYGSRVYEQPMNKLTLRWIDAPI